MSMKNSYIDIEQLNYTHTHKLHFYEFVSIFIILWNFDYFIFLCPESFLAYPNIRMNDEMIPFDLYNLQKPNEQFITFISR